MEPTKSTIDAAAAAEQGLAKAEAQTPAVITTPAEYRQSVSRWQSNHYHVLSPATTFSGLPPSYGMVAAMVQLNPHPDAGDVYSDPLFCKDGEVAITKIGLSKIAQAAGMSIKTERTDPRTIANYWEVRATCRFIGLDGRPQELEATCEYDLRDGAPRIEKMVEAARKKSRDPRSQITGMRQHGLRGAEARAINAAIRLFGIRQKYTTAELAKPFVAVRVMFQPDMSDPETKRIVTEQAMQGATALYPHSRPALPAAEALDTIGAVDDAQGASPQSVGRGSTSRLADASPNTTANTASSANAKSAQKDDAPPTPDSVRIVDIKTYSGETNGRKWVRCGIVDSNGEEHSTFSRTLMDAAEKFKASRQWVEIVTETDGQYKNLVEIAPAGESPKLPGMSEL